MTKESFVAAYKIPEPISCGVSDDYLIAEHALRYGRSPELETGHASDKPP